MVLPFSLALWLCHRLPWAPVSAVRSVTRTPHVQRVISLCCGDAAAFHLQELVCTVSQGPLCGSNPRLAEPGRMCCSSNLASFQPSLLQTAFYHSSAFLLFETPLIYVAVFNVHSLGICSYLLFFLEMDNFY